MDKFYYDTISALEKAGRDPEYINGWACGYLNNPLREEQRVNASYTHGYEDGKNRLSVPSDPPAAEKSAAD